MARNSLPDEQLARSAADGDLEAFAELLARHRDRVYRICLRMAGNREDAEDWAQDSFVRIYQGLRAYNPARPFGPWALRVASNCCVNRAVARGRRVDRLHVSSEEPATAEELGPLARAIAGEERARLLAAIDRLEPLLRQAVILRACEGMSFRELAEVLNVPLQTAASRVRRALLQVRESLSAEGIGIEQ